MITKEQIAAEKKSIETIYYADTPSPADVWEEGVNWAIEQLQPEIDALKAENEKIKTSEAELARLVVRWSLVTAENQHLQTKLKTELEVRDVWMDENKRLRDGLNSMLNIEARDAIEELQGIYKIIESLNP